jgi:hypothetical protein
MTTLAFNFPLAAFDDFARWRSAAQADASASQLRAGLRAGRSISGQFSKEFCCKALPYDGWYGNNNFNSMHHDI